jgi:hypothetical protein
VERLQVELTIGLDRGEPNVVPIDCLGNRFGAKKVVIVGLYERLHELSWNQLLVCPCARNTRPRRCAPEHASIPLSDVCSFAEEVISCLWLKFLSAAPFLQEHLAVIAKSHQVKGSSCQDQCRPNEICISMILASNLPTRSTTPKWKIRRRTISVTRFRTVETTAAFRSNDQLRRPAGLACGDIIAIT